MGGINLMKFNVTNYEISPAMSDSSLAVASMTLSGWIGCDADLNGLEHQLMYAREVDIVTDREMNKLRDISIRHVFVPSFVKSEPKIKKVIFNEPATIVLWADGTKTVVTCQEGETYDKEKGIALCFMKKIMNNKGNYNNIIKEWINE